jgi:serine phosphatase RsbU (regulator of sigma subunit)
VLVLYTDGITEVMSIPDTSGGRDLFGTARLDRVLLAGEPGDERGAATYIQRVMAATAAFAGHDPSRPQPQPRDDQTAIVLRRVG